MRRKTAIRLKWIATYCKFLSNEECQIRAEVHRGLFGYRVRLYMWTPRISSSPLIRDQAFTVKQAVETLIVMGVACRLWRNKTF